VVFPKHDVHGVIGVVLYLAIKASLLDVCARMVSKTPVHHTNSN
jgi:hypothetical protein